MSFSFSHSDAVAAATRNDVVHMSLLPKDLPASFALELLKASASSGSLDVMGFLINQRGARAVDAYQALYEKANEPRPERQPGCPPVLQNDLKGERGAALRGLLLLAPYVRAVGMDPADCIKKDAAVCSYFANMASVEDTSTPVRRPRP